MKTMPTWEEMTGVATTEFREYQVPKVGMAKRKIYLPMKRVKRGGFIDDAMAVGKTLPSSDKYNGHKDWNQITKF